MDVALVGTTLPAGVTVGSPLANMPAGGGGFNAWLQMCNQQIPSAVAAGAWYNLALPPTVRPTSTEWATPATTTAASD